MTNDMPPPENGVANDPTAASAVETPSTPAEAATEPVTEAAVEVVPAEPPAPTFDDLGLHPDVKLALDDMGYFAPTPVQTAVFRPVSEGKDLLVQSRTG